MEYFVSYEEGLDIVSGKIEGDLTANLAARYFNQVAELAAENRCTRVLTDVRNAKLLAKETDMESLSKDLTNIGLRPAIKRAIVLSNDVKAYKTWENHCFRNGHMRLKLFFDQDKAIDWLSNQQ